MRVTHRMVSETVSFNIQQNLSRLNRIAGQLASGRVFQKPSQDPAGVNKVMSYETAIKRNEQFRRNINESLSWLNATESALMEVLKTLQELRANIVYGATGSLSAQDRLLMANGVEEMYNHLLSTANTDFNGLFIFGGHQTSRQPYRFNEAGELGYYGDGRQRNIEISPYQTVTVNITGVEAFSGTGLFDTVASVHRAFLDNDPSFLGGEALEKIDGYIDLILQRLSEVGGRIKRAEAMRSALEYENILLKELLSQVRDIDFAYTVMQFQLQENAYQASLSTAARILQPSLVDYLR